jgi:hypothetical protein
MSGSSRDELNVGLADAHWSTADLWVASVSVGGNLTQRDVGDIISGARAATPLEHDVLAASLNDYFTERGQDHPVPYWRDLTPERPLSSPER